MLAEIKKELDTARAEFRDSMEPAEPMEPELKQALYYGAICVGATLGRHSPVLESIPYMNNGLFTVLVAGGVFGSWNAAKILFPKHTTKAEAPVKDIYYHNRLTADYVLNIVHENADRTRAGLQLGARAVNAFAHQF